jgi:hypothetical protein
MRLTVSENRKMAIAGVQSLPCKPYMVVLAYDVGGAYAWHHLTREEALAKAKVLERRARREGATVKVYGQDGAVICRLRDAAPR